jgi:type IV pilus assembly protein PilC
MAEFTYNVMDKNGKIVTGTIVANDYESAIDILKSRGFYVVDVSEKTILQKDIKFSLGKKVSFRELSVFCRQMATMLQSGINILVCIDAIENQINNKRFAKIIRELHQKVEKGTPISFAMRDYPDVFPNIMINLIEAGEVGGSIDDSFEKMAVYFEKEYKLKQKVTNALIYPVIVLLVAIAVLNILLIFVLPTFVGLFNDIGVELPATTRAILAASKFMSNYWYIILIFVLFGVWLFKVYKKTPAGRLNADTIKLKLPILGQIAVNTVTARFARTLSALMGAGVSLVAALDTTKKVFSNAFVEKEFEKVIEDVKGGENLSFSIEKLNLFPMLVPIMIRTGEESGSLERMLERVADMYESEVENSVTRLTTLFEPIMIVFLALIVGLLLSSIMLPMFKIYGNIT